MWLVVPSDSPLLGKFVCLDSFHSLRLDRKISSLLFDLSPIYHTLTILDIMNKDANVCVIEKAMSAKLNLFPL